jgi:hypothetical protein
MADSNLSVKITADTTNFTAAMAVSKAALNDRAAALREAIKAETSFGTANIAAAQAVQQAAENVARAQAQVRGLNEQLKATSATSNAMGGSLQGLNATLSKAFAVTGVGIALEGINKLGQAITTLGDRAIEIRTMSEVLGVTTSQFQAMSVAGEEAGVSAQVFARASERLTNLLSEARDGAGKAVEKLHELGVSTQDIANKNFQLNDVLAVLKTRLEDVNTKDDTRKALLQELGARTALAIEAIKEYDGSERGVSSAMTRVNGLLPEQVEHLKEAKTWWSEMGTAAANTASKMVAAAAGMLDAYKNAVLAKNPQLGSAGPSSGPGHDASSTGEARAAEESARQQEAVHNEVLHSEMESVKEGVAAFASGTAERLAALQRYASLAKQYYGAGNVDEVRKANSEVLAAEREFHDTQSREAITSAKEQAQAVMADTSLSLSQRLDDERTIWSGVLASDKLGNAQRIEAAREFSREYTEVAKQTAAQAAAVSRIDASTDIAIEKIQLDAKRSALEQELQANQVTAAQKLAIMRQLASESFSLDLQALTSELQTLREGTAEYERVYSQIRELKARLVADLEGYDSQYQKDLAKQLKEQSALWKSTVGEIESVEGTLVTDVLTKRKTLAQTLIQVSSDLITKEIANDIKAFTTKLLLNDQTKALEQGGLLYHALFQTQKTAATVTAEAAQTSAVVSGQAAQNAALTSGAAAGKAVQASTGPAEVMALAAEAFAGAFAATAAIPYIGPELAPAAGAEAYAAVASMSGPASLDVGTNYVPRDMIAQLHEGESVQPKAYNPAAGGRDGGGGDTHLHLNMSAFDASGMDRLVHSQGFRDAVASSMNKHINRGGRLG